VQVVEMLGDYDNNIYFEIRRGRRSETVSRGELIGKNVRALIDFYEKSIQFRLPFR
jgi:hypothetical protein